MTYRGAVTAPQVERDVQNTRIDNLTTGNTWTGSWVDADGVLLVSVAAKSDYSVTLTIEQSSDGTTVDVTRTFTVAASQETTRVFSPARKYYRVSVANASGSTAALRVETKQWGGHVRPADILPEPTWREHRLMTTPEVTSEIAEDDWISGQAIDSRATTNDAQGIYKRASSGTNGFEAVCFWVDTNGAVVDSTANITLRPYMRFTVGSKTRVAYGGSERAKPPGDPISFEDTAPGAMWLKVEDATLPGSTETHLQIYVMEVQ